MFPPCSMPSFAYALQLILALMGARGRPLRDGHRRTRVAPLGNGHH